MATINWRTRNLSGNRVRLDGTVRLSCGHHVTEGAQVRNADAAIAQGKETITALLTTLTSEHVKECGR